MRYLIMSLAFLMLPGLISCQKSENDPSFYKEKINTKSLSNIGEIITNTENMSTEDLRLLNSAINYYSPVKDSLNGKTIGELITSQREREKQNAMNQLKATSFNVASSQALKFNISKFEPIDQEGGKPLNVPTYQFMNVSDKTIKKIEGFLNVYNGNQLVKRYTVEVEKDIPAEKTLNQPYPYEHKTDNQRDVVVRENFNKLRKVWIPTLIEFEDGTTLDRSKLVDKKEEENENASE